MLLAHCRLGKILYWGVFVAYLCIALQTWTVIIIVCVFVKLCEIDKSHSVQDTSTKLVDERDSRVFDSLLSFVLILLAFVVCWSSAWSYLLFQYWSI